MQFPLALLQMPGDQSILHPAGPAARDISTLAWIIFITFLIVSFVMWILIAWLAFRRRGSVEDRPPVDPEGGHTWIYAGGLAIPVVILTTFFVLNLRTLGGFPIHEHVDPPPQILVLGHQWWWEVQYVAGPVQEHFTTANELHIPVGQDIDIELIGTDVMHSFWVPTLHGKEDLVPGQDNFIRLRADQAGTYRGQCAEFCGAQHAHMGMLIIADPPDEYQAWLVNQRKPGVEPQDPEARQGEQVFLSTACALCHSVRGTPAGGGIAPDLTHIATRQGLAAETLPNDTSDLEAWVTHAQSFKPGAEMPDLTQYSGAELRSLVAYLQQLK
jgi:cytochrome c oxidase subunit II